MVRKGCIRAGTLNEGLDGGDRLLVGKLTAEQIILACRLVNGLGGNWDALEARVFGQSNIPEVSDFLFEHFDGERKRFWNADVVSKDDRICSTSALAVMVVT